MKHQRLQMLGNPLFVISVCLLVLNDAVLKQIFHNWFTGKLSDFSGLLAFSLFCCSLWPHRRLVIAVTVSAGFILWKSPCSQSLIDSVNHAVPFTIGRTIDPTDCIALPVVWLVCSLFQKLRPWPVRPWLTGAFACLSLVAFAATSHLPGYSVSRNAIIPVPSAPVSVGETERELQVLFDKVANEHGLSCVICDPMPLGRLYAQERKVLTKLSLAVSFDARKGIIFFDVGSLDRQGSPTGNKADALLMEIKNRLTVRFPGLKIESTQAPKQKTVQLGVYKKDGGSWETPENLDDCDRAFAVIDKIMSERGLKRSSPARGYSAYYCTGRLLGSRPCNRQLVVHVGVADWPLVPIQIDCYSDEYRELQDTIADDLEQKLQAEFGKERAGRR